MSMQDDLLDDLLAVIDYLKDCRNTFVKFCDNPSYLKIFDALVNINGFEKMLGSEIDCYQIPVETYKFSEGSLQAQKNYCSEENKIENLPREYDEKDYESLYRIRNGESQSE